MKRTHGLLATIALLAVLTACGSPDQEATGTASPTEGDGAPEPVLEVAAAFYPLELAVQRVGGDRVSVVPLTQPGADPHDAELTPREVGRLSSADLVVYLAGFQPAVDDAVSSVGAEALEVSEHADLTLTVTDDGHSHGHDHSGESEEEHAEHSDEHADEHSDEQSDAATDPHFWLDPTRYAVVAEAIADRLAELDPEGSTVYEAGVADFTAELTALDEEFMAGLETCTHRDLVTGHAAFGYLADRYNLVQRGIAGLSPESEPSAVQIRDLVEYVRDSGVSTIYAETLVSPALAETIARESGATVAVLDPLEGLTDASAGEDYLEVMRSNLQTLREGQDCS